MIALYLALGSFVAGLAMGGYGAWDYMAGKAAQEKADLAEAQAKVDELALQVRTTAAQSLENERQAFIAGEANAKTITKTIYAKGQQNVATYDVFRNPVCVLPADVLRELNGARQGIVLATATPGSHGSVPGTGTPAGRADGNALSTNAQGLGTVSGVQAPTGNAGGDGQVSGTGSRRVPTNPLKPK